MLRFSRSGDTPPEKHARIIDGAAAKAWLAGMAQPATIQNLEEMARVLQALGALGVQDGAPNLPPERKFAIAERIRGVLLGILGERTGEDRFAVLPLDDEFARHFWAAIHAAIALRDVYAWLVSQLKDTPIVAEPAVTALTGHQMPTTPIFVSGVGALHRALDVNAQVLSCIQRARWAVPTDLWERHCVLGQLVRDLDCQDIEVADALRLSITKTCRGAFVMPLMIALADPAARPAPEFEVVRMAAQRWSAKVGFRLERRSEVASAPARPVANPGPTVTLGNYVLRFDTQSALQSIDRRLEALADGKSPREVGIGDILRPQNARDLLLVLKQRWGSVNPGDIDSPDRSWRHTPGGAMVLAVVGLSKPDAKGRDGDPSAGGAGRAGPSPYAYQRVRTDGITRPREEIDNEVIAKLLANAETWTLAAESPDAVRCIRKYARPRIGLQRLVGLKLGGQGGDAPFLLGWVEALQGSTVSRDGDAIRLSGAHSVRIRLAPGVPQVLKAAIDDVSVDGAFLLVPGVAVGGRAGRVAAYVPMLSHPGQNAAVLSNLDGDGWDAVRASPREFGLILPHATFRPHRLVKAARRGVVAMLRLEELMMRGSDFDLVRFTPL